MVRVKIRNIIGLILLVVFVVGGIIIASMLFPKEDKQLKETIYEYCKKNTSVKLADLTEFDWDTAYIDYEHYERGKALKDKYQIKGDFKELESDNLYRIAFCKKNELVCDLILNEEDIQIDSQIESITQTTVLTVEWRSNSSQGETLCLSKGIPIAY